MIALREPTDEDIAALAETMREMDRLECALLGAGEPIEALERGVSGSLWALAAEVDGRVIAIGGVSGDSLMANEGRPWMLCAEGIERHARAFMPLAHPCVACMSECYERLSNIVHAHNRSAIRFIKWCGFTIGEEIIVGGAPFLKFEKRAA